MRGDILCDVIGWVDVEAEDARVCWEDLSNACVWLLVWLFEWCCWWWWELIESRTLLLYILSWGSYRWIPNWLQVDCRYSELTVDQWCCFWWCHSQLEWSSPTHCHFGRCRFVPEPERRVSAQLWIWMNRWQFDHTSRRLECKFHWKSFVLCRLF